MDKDGIIGIFAVDEEKDRSKICIRLAAKLNQKAMKKELEMLTVFPNDGKAKLFLDMNYETFDTASGEFGVEDKFMLVKRIKLEDKVEFFDEQGKKLTLNPAKKIRVEGTHSVFPFFFFGLACFFAFLFIIITARTYDPNEFMKSLAVCIGIGLIFLVALGVLIFYFVRAARFKKKVLSMNITTGIITGLTEDVVRVREDNHTTSEFGKIKCTYVNITYVFYDENMQKFEAKFSYKYNGKAPYFYHGQKLIIAYDSKESFILNKYTLFKEQKRSNDIIESKILNNDEEKTISSNEKFFQSYVPINGVKRYYTYSISFFVMLVITLIATLILSIIGAVNSNLTFIQFWVKFWPFHVFVLIVTGIPSTIFAVIHLQANLTYKKGIKQQNIILYDGQIVYSSPIYKEDNRFKFFCEYKENGEKRKIAVPKIIGAVMLKKGKTSIKVASFTDYKIVVVKKGKFPDSLKRFNKNDTI